MGLPNINDVIPGYIYVDSESNVSYIVKEHQNISGNTIKVWDINKASAGAAMEVYEIPIATLPYFGTTIKLLPDDILYICESSEKAPTSDDQCYWIRMFETKKNIPLPNDEDIGFRFEDEDIAYELIDDTKKIWHYGSKEAILNPPDVEPPKEFSEATIDSIVLANSVQKEFIDNNYYDTLFIYDLENKISTPKEFAEPKISNINLSKTDVSEFIDNNYYDTLFIYDLENKISTPKEFAEPKISNINLELPIKVDFINTTNYEVAVLNDSNTTYDTLTDFVGPKSDSYALLSN